LEIETNGSIGPRRSGPRFRPSLVEQRVPPSWKVIELSAFSTSRHNAAAAVRSILLRPVDGERDCRSFGQLKAENIYYIGDLIGTRAGCSRPNLGRKSLNRNQRSARFTGLTLGMKRNWPPASLDKTLKPTRRVLGTGLH
jgi:DNA-directed RNA polymerase alpha subunit